MLKYIALGKKIYRIKYHKELRRMLVFVLRCIRLRKEVDSLLDFFHADTRKEKIIEEVPCIIEQVTRSFFYNASTPQERLKLIQEHFDFCLNNFIDTALNDIYVNKKMVIWEGEYKEQPLTLDLHFDPGERKEGLLTLSLSLNKTMVYQITFWFAENAKGEPVICLGALQGMNGGSKLIKGLTKHFHGYRTKNLILYALRVLAQSLGIKEILAVSNEGFYANNHLRLDRKLKTDLNAFWLETGGEASADNRFYKLPVTEPRKSMEEVVSHKRSLYRKRFAALDALAESLAANLKSFLR